MVLMPWDSPACSLGSFQQFDGDYRAMAFENGAGCWQGPARSIKVISSASAVHGSDRNAICSIAAAAQAPLGFALYDRPASSAMGVCPL